MILIDDARNFLHSLHGCHSDHEDWPTIFEILMPFTGDQVYVQICEDIIYIIPDEPELRRCLGKYTGDVLLQFEISRSPKRQLIQLSSKILKKIGLYIFVKNIYRKIYKKG